MSDGYNQKQTLYYSVIVGNLDGTVDFHSESPTIYETEEEAVADMKGESEIETVIYRMTPIWRSVKHFKFEHLDKENKNSPQISRTKKKR